MTGKSDDWDDHDVDDDDNDHENNNKCCHPCLLLGERIVTFPSTPAPIPLSLLSSTVLIMHSMLYTFSSSLVNIYQSS